MSRKCFTIAALVALVCSAGSVLLRGSDDAELSKLQEMAAKIQGRFKGLENSPAFGSGLKPELVQEVKTDSEKFWNDIRDLKAADLSAFSAQDGFNAIFTNFI